MKYYHLYRKLIKILIKIKIKFNDRICRISRQLDVFFRKNFRFLLPIF